MPKSLELARVLLVDDELSSRLTLQTLLEAGGYSVDVAGSAAEAFSKLDEGQYELVLSEAEVESPQAGRQRAFLCPGKALPARHGAGYGL